MSVFPKWRPRKRLAAEEYQQLQLNILQRDHWQCQFCGRSTNLEVHHISFRSQSGADDEKNLITLCHACHLAIHTGSG
jgi:5-methylcytosine-specific restriction endonuclease McrA